MINAIQKIGEYVAGKEVNQEKFLKNICLHIEPTREIKQKDKPPKKVKQHIVFINFITNNENTIVKQNNQEKEQLAIFDNVEKPTGKIEITFEEVNASGKNAGKEYFFVGNASAHSPKIYATSNNFSNVIQSLLLLKDNGMLLNNFFQKKKYKKGKVEKNIYYLNSSYFQYSEKNAKKIDEIKEKLKKKSDEKKIKKLTAENLNITEKEIIKTLGLTSDDVSHFTIKIDDKFVCKMEEYPDIIFNEKIEKLFGYSKKKEYKDRFQSNGICSICGKEKILTTSNVTNLKFKFYMNDKLGFASNLDGHFKNNYNICKNCYQHLMIAERYIDEVLKSRIGGLNVYILPKFILPVDKFEIDDFAKYIKFKNQQISDLRRAEDILEDKLEIFEKYENKYLINYLFYQKSKSKFKIFKLIKDIPPSRINFIKRKEQDISNLIDDKFDGYFSFKIDLNRIWSCIPVKIQKESKFGYSKYLDIIDNIFSNRKINYDFLIGQAIGTLNIIKFETPKYNIWNQEDIVNKIINLNFLILFMKKLNILGGLKMNKQRNEHFTDDMIPKEIFEYWENLEIYQDNKKKGLFLLGYLIGEVGSKQSSQQIKNKPILNKINFQGMGTEKLNRLSSNVLEKLKQYKLLDFKENVYSASHLLIEENIKNWSLSNQENVFYILSGFAFSNYLIRKRSKENYKNELEAKIELIEKMKSKGKNVEEFEKLFNEAIAKADEHKYYNANEILKQIKIKKQEEK